MRRLSLAALLLSLLLAAPAHANIWTQTDTGLGSGDNIRAVEYQSASRLWLATSNGKIATRQPAGNFTVTANIGAVNGFNDIAFKPGSSTGIAVANNGYIQRTTNGGQNWTRINFTEPTANTRADFYGCGNYNTGPVGTPLNTRTNPAIALYSVHWGPGSTVIITGLQSTVLRSTDDGATFNEISRYARPYSDTDSTGTIGCRIGGTYGVNIFDAQFASTTDPTQIYFQTDGGPVFYTDNGLADGGTPVQTSDIGCSGVFGRLAIDPNIPNNQWSTTDRGSGGRCLYYTTSTSAGDYQFPRFPNDSGQTEHQSEDIAAGGTGSPPTLVTVEKGGNILNSIDGQNFYYNRVSNTDTTDYYSVSGFSANDFAVGGANGKLLVTSSAGTIPDIVPPAGTVSGPTTLVAGQTGTYTANVADENGGSGIDTGSFAWTTTGLPAASGNPVARTFASPGYYTVTVAFKDRAGNAATASLGVSVTAPTTTTTTTPTTTTTTPKPTVITPGTTNPKATTTSSVTGGGSVTLSGPKTCVAPGKTFSARLSFKRSTKKGAKAIKVTKVDFYVDNKKVKTDKKAPFSQRLSVKSYTVNSTHTLKARAKIKVRRGNGPTKAVSTSFQVCAF